MSAYYNEMDRFAAAWLRELIKRNLIAPGEVDERSIADVRSDDLVGFDQVHFFAGIGVWSYALRRAGWPDDRPVWSGSCPCQPFSCAGKGAGFDDSRHLWPEMFRLINECRPVVVLGEQVASKDGLAWLDAVQADLEGAGYAVGAVDSCAAGFGAPHIRQRMYWVGHAIGEGLEGHGWHVHNRRQPGRLGAVACGPVAETGGVVRVADSNSERRTGQHALLRAEEGRGGTQAVLEAARSCEPRGLADAKRNGGRADQQEWRQERGVADGRDSSRLLGNGPARPTDGYWRDADWLFCRDGKWRAVEPGTSPLATGAAARVVRLRGYGNSIVAPVAQAFIEAVMEVVE